MDESCLSQLICNGTPSCCRTDETCCGRNSLIAVIVIAPSVIVLTVVIICCFCLYKRTPRNRRRNNQDIRRRHPRRDSIFDTVAYLENNVNPITSLPEIKKDLSFPVFPDEPPPEYSAIHMQTPARARPE